MENDTSATDEPIEYVELLNSNAYDQETTSEMPEMDEDTSPQQADGIMHEIITIAEAEDVSMLENYEEIQYVEAEVEITENTLITQENQTIFIHDGRKYIIPNDQLTNGDHTIVLDEEDGQLIAQDDEEQQEMFYTTSTDIEADVTRQFAVLKDGKLHLTNIEEETNETDEIQEKLRHFESSLTNYEVEEEDEEESDRLEEITGKNLITGQTISLSGILEKMRRKSNGYDLRNINVKQPRNTQQIQQQSQDYVLVPPVTRRVVVGRTHDGKRLVGRILQIQKKIQPNELKINQSSQNTFSIAMPTQKRIIKQRKKEPQQLQQHLKQQLQLQQQQQQQLQLRYMSRSVLDENVARTLAGLMDLESINKKLKGRRLIVRHIQRRSREGKIITGSKKIAYYCGRLKRQSLADSWTFVQETPAAKTRNESESENENGGIDLPENLNEDNSEKINLRLNDEGRLITSDDSRNNDQATDDGTEYGHRHEDDDDNDDNETLTLYLTETQDEYGKKKTKVTIPEYTQQKAGKPTEATEDLTCKFCGKKFQSLGSLRRHGTVHDHSLRPLQCLTCLGRFTDESSLKKHMILHTGVRPHKCNLCDKSFAHRGDLNFHVRTHDPVKRYECSVCRKQFNRHSNMLRHAEIHRPAEPGPGPGHTPPAKAPILIAMNDDEYEENSGESKTAPFTCDQCGIQYNYSSSLTRHIVNVHLKQTDD